MDSQLLNRRIIVAAASGNLKYLQDLQNNITDRWRCKTARIGGRNALHVAIIKGQVQICKFLIETADCNVNVKTANGNSSLILAVINEHLDLVKYLISKGADPDACNYQGCTALHFAVKYENEEIMELLLSDGCANIEAKSIRGTPLEYAASWGKAKSVRILITHGAKTCPLPPVIARPAIVRAILIHATECIKILLTVGDDINMDVLGKTPLAYAAKVGEPEVITILLEANANPNSVSSKDGLKPIEYAAKAGKYEAIRVLFPVTEKIQYIEDWSIDGIIGYYSPRRLLIDKTNYSKEFCGLNIL